MARKPKTAVAATRISKNAPDIPFMTGEPLPIIAHPALAVFPQTISPMLLDTPEAIAALDHADLSNRLVMVMNDFDTDAAVRIAKIDSDMPAILPVVAGNQQMMPVGTVCRIIKTLRFPDGTARILLRGLGRAVCTAIESSPDDKAPLQGQFSWLPESDAQSTEIDALTRMIRQSFGEIVELSPNLPDEMRGAINGIEGAEHLADVVTDTMNFAISEKVVMLATNDLTARLEFLLGLLAREREVLKIGAEIQSQVQENITRNNREHYLREQLEVLRRELGETSSSDIQAYRKRMEVTHLPEQVKEVVKREIDRMEMIPPASAEYHVSANYIDWLLSIPWETYTEDRLDIHEAARFLDEDHYGIKEVKDRILEHLAVLQLKNNHKSPILCFVGPPGVGKTSLGQSIARAMNRKFVRVSLGGVRDESEIRGHRRTYVGALPGRIITGMKKAGSNNPVFMLDELDKLSRDFHGDPGAALLEVLDPQQNNTFNDHFLDLDYDLSSVFFIATANVTDTLPPALRDRLEIIRLSGYTAFEKRMIARNFLIPRQFDANGIDLKQLVLTDDAIDEIITYYTMEAGVRMLERTLGSVCRKFARKLLEGEVSASKPTRLTAKDVKKILGGRKYQQDEALRKPEVGVATGMAWTGVGGTILPVEVSVMHGKGDLKLTGSLGEVMKESAQTAYSYIRAHAELFGIDAARFPTSDIHIHVPDGSTPKDGPSAGITLTVALVSALTGRKVDSSFAMTGEITLRGKVTAIGGVKEKSMAALRTGIKKIILPEDNRKDLEEIPAEIINDIDFRFVSTIAEALKILLLPAEKPKRKKK